MRAVLVMPAVGTDSSFTSANCVGSNPMALAFKLQPAILFPCLLWQSHGPCMLVAHERRCSSRDSSSESPLQGLREKLPSVLLAAYSLRMPSAMCFEETCIGPASQPTVSYSLSSNCSEQAFFPCLLWEALAHAAHNKNTVYSSRDLSPESPP